MIHNCTYLMTLNCSYFCFSTTDKNPKFLYHAKQGTTSGIWTRSPLDALSSCTPVAYKTAFSTLPINAVGKNLMLILRKRASLGITFLTNFFRLQLIVFLFHLHTKSPSVEKNYLLLTGKEKVEMVATILSADMIFQGFILLTKAIIKF